MAFKEVYTDAVRRAGDSGEQVEWRASLGHSKSGRDESQQEAERRQALAECRPMLRLERQHDPLLLEHWVIAAERSTPADQAVARNVIAQMRAALRGAA